MSPSSPGDNPHRSVERTAAELASGDQYELAAVPAALEQFVEQGATDAAPPDVGTHEETLNDADRRFVGHGACEPDESTVHPRGQERGGIRY